VAKIESAQPAEIRVTREVEQENVDLMVSHAWASSRGDLGHGLIARPTEITKTS